MASKYSVPGLFLLLFCVCCVHCDVTLEKNGYKGIVVALSPRVEVNNAQIFFDSLRNLFSNASRAVFHRLNNRAFFEEITLILPKESKLQEGLDLSSVSYAISSKPTYDSAHFVVQPQGVFGNTPYTLQFGPCGTQGLRTILPLPYLSESKADDLSEEWLRLRYGVFSAESFPGDPLYSEGMASKQDVLCGSDPVDYVLKSKDFNATNLPGESEWKEPVFKIVREAPLRFVVAWDIESSKSKGSPKVKRTRTALSKYATSMAPRDSRGALIYFGDDVLDGHDILRDMSGPEKDSFTEYFPTKPKGSSTLSGALEKARDILKQGASMTSSETSSVTGGTILLITERNVSNDEYIKAKVALQETDVTLHALILAGYRGDDTLQRLVGEFRGKVVSVPVTDEALSVGIQAESIAAVLQRNSDSPNMVVLQSVFKNGLPAEEEWDVPIELDLKAAGNLRVDITKKTMDDNFRQSIQLSSPGNEATYTSLSQNFSPKNDFFCRWFDMKDPSPGTWALKISSRDEDDNEPLIVIAKSEPNKDEDIIRADVWISESSDGVNPLKPFIIYAEVRKGVSPIRGAEVEATVKTPTGNDTFHLFDNGKGDPDITEGDGIYSRYFTGFSTEGHYTLSVRVSGNEHTETVLPRSEDGLRCCGSVFPKEPSEKTGLFSRHTLYGSFITLQDVPPGDIFPPSRVTDLVAKDVDSANMQVTLQWTAPGNDFDHGRAKKYEMRYSNSEDEFKKEFEQAGMLIDPMHVDGLGGSPKEYGELETATLKNLDCKRKPDSCYFALRAKDESNYGPVSNVVRVQFDEMPVTTPGGGDHVPDPSTDGKDSVEYSRGGTSLNLIIGISVPLIILIIILAVIAVLFVNRRRKKDKQHIDPDIYSEPHQNGKPSDRDSSADPNKNQYAALSELSTSISPVNSYPADYLLEKYEEEKKRKADKAPTAPQKEELPASSDESSVGKANRHPIWWMPRGPQAQEGMDPTYEQPAELYAMVNKPPKDSSPARMQTFV